MSHTLDANGSRRLGGLVRDARTRAGMSRATLALHAGVSPSTVKNVEGGKDVSAQTLRGLLSVRELALPDDLRGELHGDARGISPNAWYAPGFTPLAEFRHMLATLRGAGGLIEQTYLYYDHSSAIDWFQIAAQQEYAEAQRIMPLCRAADQLFHSVGERGMDVIALGPGDGRLETRLVAHLAQLLEHPAIRFYLLDISQPLLAEAYRHAADTLSLYAGITPIAIQGNFHHLPHYTQLLYVPQLCPRRQIAIMIGGTFGNIDDERHFIRDSMCGFSSGSLVLIDYPCCFAQADQPDEIRRRDPWLNGGGKGSVAWRDRVTAFWSGPIRRYIPGVKSVELRMELSTSSSTIPRSYAVEVMARVEAEDQPDRNFSLFRIKRHEPTAVIQVFRELGWEHVDGWPYGQEVGYPRMLSLFQRRG